MYTLHNGDCLTVLPSIPSGSIDAIITDLPYGTTACAWDVVIPFSEMWREVKRVLKPTGVFITTSKQPFTSALIMSNPSYWREEVIWEKERPSNLFNVHFSHGQVHENIQVFGNGGHTFNPQKYKNGSNKTREKMQRYVQGGSLKHHGEKATKMSYRADWDGSLSMPRSVVYFLRDRDIENHETQKPVALYEYLIRTYTNEGETVLDICMGSGTTIEAAERMQRNSIGIELKAEYFEKAEKRLKSLVLLPQFLTPSNKVCSGRLDSSASQSSFITNESSSLKVAGATRRR
jgi:site-specific DNA-methyltransferase (adenine-specific)